MVTCGLPANVQALVCNNTNFVMLVTLGHEENKEIVTEGWWKIYPGYCEDLIKYKHKKYFIHSETDPRITEEKDSQGIGNDIALCVKKNDFNNLSNSSCESHGGAKINFDKIDGLKYEITLNKKYKNRTEAQIAGIQYLLRQLEYKVNVDGVLGEKTLRAIRDFSSHQGICGLNFKNVMTRLDAVISLN